jgi:hypothetical protein
VLIAWARDKRRMGVDPPKGGSDFRLPARETGNERGVRCDYQVAHVDVALSDKYRTDAHFVPYVVLRDGAPIMKQPRVNKDGLGWMREQGYEVVIGGLVADIDNPGHAPWPSAEAARVAVYRAKGLVPQAIVYSTRGGLRIVQPLRRPLRPEEAEGALAAWLGLLEHAGLVPDRGCLDWTRHYRLPHVARDGGALEQAAAMVTSCEPIDPPAPVSALRRGSSRRGAPRGEGPIAWSPALPPHLVAAVAPIADALRTVPGSWHEAHLAIAGALAKGGVDPAHLPAMAVAIAGVTSDTKPDDRRTAAETTARRYAAGSEVKGMRWLLQHAPAVAQVLEQLVGKGRAPVHPAVLPLAPTMLREQVAQILVREVRGASERLKLIVVPPGTGKTHAVREVAVERARKERRAGATRSPLGSRTGISVPDHQLAGQVANDVIAAGEPVLRLVGLASYKDPAGQLVCIYAAQAGALAAGGCSVRLELCEGRGRPCPRKDTCEARGGMIGPEDARIVVAPHALIGQLDELVGKTGLLAIDEPPSMLRTERFRLEHLDAAIERLGLFAPRYAAGVRPALLAVRAWLGLAAEQETGPLARAWATGADADALEGAHDAIGATSVEEAARGAVPDEARTQAPPLTGEAAWEARWSAARAKETGDAAKVLRDVREATIRPDASAGTIELDGDGRPVLVLTLLVEGLRRAVRREGAVIVLAADADLHAPMLARAVGYEPDVVRVAAAEGAPVRRVHLEAPASRARWLRGGKAQKGPILEALAAGVAELERSGARTALVVTWLAIRRELGQAPEVLALLARVGGELAHYGGLRGLDRWRDVDGVLTLGDPRPNLGDVRRELLVVGDASDQASTARIDALAAAELEQAHGRARLIHRAPDRPCTLVHVGEVTPRGWYAPVEVRPLGARAPGDEDELRRAVAAVGGTTAAGTLVGRSPGEVRRWMNGARAPPPEIARRLIEASRGSLGRGES